MAKGVTGFDEYAAFQKRFAAAVGRELAGDAKTADALMRANPELAEAMKEMSKEARKLNGTPLLTTTSFDVTGTAPEKGTPAPAEQPKQEEPAKLERPSVGGLLGRFGKKKLEEHQKAKEEEKAQQGGRANLMTATTRYTGFSSDALAADLFQPPAGYQEVKPKD